MMMFQIIVRWRTERLPHTKRQLEASSFPVEVVHTDKEEGSLAWQRVQASDAFEDRRGHDGGWVATLRDETGKDRIAYCVPSRPRTETLIRRAAELVLDEEGSQELTPLTSDTPSAETNEVAEGLHSEIERVLGYEPSSSLGRAEHEQYL